MKLVIRPCNAHGCAQNGAIEGLCEGDDGGHGFVGLGDSAPKH
jgi:hypothetical protein